MFLFIMFYAVRIGRRPGIYTSWEACQEQILRFPAASYKKFKTEDEARAFLSTATNGPASPKVGPVYAVRSGRQPGLYSTWDECRTQVDRFPQAEYKKFKSIQEAEAYMQQSVIGVCEPEFDSKSNQPNLTSPIDEKRPRTIIYTDGSTLGNGQPGARSGIGVFFGVNDPRNLSAPVDSITNQRSELLAAIRALEIVADDEDVEIRTDSKYVVNGITEWIKAWRKQEENDAVINLDLFRSLDKRVQHRRGRTVFVHVPGHQGEFGNEMADQLARSGAVLALRSN